MTWDGWQPGGPPVFDERDAEIVRSRVKMREMYDGPRVGDYVEFSDGRTGRFSHDWGDSIQWSEGGSWSLTETGHLSFSGALNPSISKARLTPTGEVRPGRCWIFHHGHWRAHNGVNTDVPCRVYRFTEAPDV